MRTIVQRAYLFFIYALLYIPILVLILFSVNDARYSMTWHGFSLRWYIELFSDSELWSAFLNSTILGISAAIIASIIGIMSSFHFYLNHDKQHRTLRSTLLLMVIVPDLVLGVSLLVFFSLLKIPLGFVSLLITHVTFCLPFVILTIESRLFTLDRNLYYCALDLGASRFIAIYKVFLPLLWPAILSAFLLCFTLSFDDVVTSYFVSGPEFTILPLAIYSLVRGGVSPELNALCTITFFISMVLVICAYLLVRRDSKCDD